MTSAPTVKQIEAAFAAATHSAGAPDASVQQLGDKFKAMMEQPRMAPPAQTNEGMGLVGEMVMQQDAHLQQSVIDTVSMTQKAPFMSMQEMVAESNRLALEISTTQVDLEAKMGVVNSSKSAVETLMKNQ